MFFYLLLIFITIPLIELALLIKIGQYIGLLNTILIVVITGILGASIARYQGLQVIFRIKEDISQGRVPAGTLFDGLLILIAGFVLITPGMLTDIFGFLLLMPRFRNLIKNYIRHKIGNMISQRQVYINYTD
ncbi:MAG: FxsA family protein [Endomicrobiales bacterium]|nr:FxsA family protein [Endomicrobiales bacterium]